MAKNKKIKINQTSMKFPVASHQINLLETPKISECNPDNVPFRWMFKSTYMHFKHSDFGFSKKYPKTKEFITEICEPLYKTYFNLTWKEVNARPHCGYIKGLTKQQRNVLNSYSDEIIENLYHINLTDSHRLFGYRKDGIFYPILDDPNHKFTK